MVKRAGLLTFSFLLLPALNSAQSNCPQGFVYVGTLSGTGSIVEGLNKQMVLKLPENAILMIPFNKPKFDLQAQRAKPVSVRRTYQKASSSSRTAPMIQIKHGR